MFRGGWGDLSVSKVLDKYTWGPELDSQHSGKSSMVTHLYSPSTGEIGAGFIWSSLDSQSSLIGRCEVNEESLLKP